MLFDHDRLNGDKDTWVMAQDYLHHKLQPLESVPGEEGRLSSRSLLDL